MTQIKRFWKLPPGEFNYARFCSEKVPEHARPAYHHKSVERIIAALDGNVPPELVGVIGSIVTPPHLDRKKHLRTILVCMLKDHLLCATDVLPSTKTLGESYLLDHSRMEIYDKVQ